ncbi:MAG: hypothetical protein K6B46_03240 [Opitutales bacterium]|nr:hypothetical protein [Opitutales bacterium]
MQKIIFSFLSYLLYSVNVFSICIEFPQEETHLTGAKLIAPFSYFDVEETKRNQNFIFFNSIDEDFILDLRIKCQKKENLLSVSFYFGEDKVFNTQYQISPFVLYSMGGKESTRIGRFFGSDYQVKEIKEEEIIIKEKYFDFISLKWGNDVESIINKASLVRVVFNQNTDDEIIFSGKYLKVWLKELIENGFYFTSKVDNRDDLFCVEIQYDISKTLRYIVRIYVSQEYLPDSIRFLSPLGTRPL